MPTELTLSRPDGTPITSWETWTRPKKDYQWEAGRSAMELAKAWFRQERVAVPTELAQLLASSARLSGLQLVRGIPEHVTGLPERGEGRNHDLWLLGRTASEQVTICVEAKADEPFGNETVAEYRASATKRRENGKPTKASERIAQLLALVPGEKCRWEKIRYQLLTAICGTAIQAKLDGSALAVFAVHEFHTSKTTPDKIAVNANDFNAFMAAIGASDTPVKPGRLYGPVTVGGVPCLIGKAVV